MSVTDAMRRQFGTDAMKLPASKTQLYEMVDVLKEQILKLNARLDIIETKGIEYRGVWQAPETYQRGNLATYQGAIWHANRETRERPGTGSAAWTLAVKGGDR